MQNIGLTFNVNQEIYYFLAWHGGKGNGNPLQCSCPENPVNGGTWWAAVHRVAQSRTWLKRLSMHVCIGEGNGNPLQCSCLENPRDGRAWWAAVYGVAQSRTRLKRLSSSSSSMKDNVKRIRHVTEWKKMFTKDTSEKKKNSLYKYTNNS